MNTYDKIISNVAKAVKRALVENQETISSEDVLSTSEKEDLIFDLAEEYISNHAEDIDDCILNIDLENSITANIMKKNYRGDNETLIPVNIVSVEINTNWRDISFWDDDDKEHIINNIEVGLDELLDETISELNDLLIQEGIREL